MKIRKHEKEFQQVIGYEFKNLNLLKTALTHSSYANECKNEKMKDNERLEFLGDAVLEIVTSEFLFKKYPDKPEGELSKLRASMVCEPTLARCTISLELGDYLYLGKGEDATGGRERPSILSDALEAIIGAIYLDGKFEPAHQFIHRFILDDIENKQLFHDSKTKLQEYIQANYSENVSYEDIGDEGPEHNKTFYVNAILGENIIATGKGRTKKAAEQEAAYQALLRMKKETEHDADIEKR